MKSPIRQFVLQALGDILSGPGGKPKDVLDTLSTGLVQRDRAFLMEIVYGVLRHRDTLDLILSWLMKKPGGVPRRTLNNLRAGIYQIFFMRVPEWAAVNESVDMEGKLRGLVNGVLRNAVRNRQSYEARLDALNDSCPALPPEDAVTAIAALTSHPRWLIKRWQQRLGTEGAHELATVNNMIPPLTLRANTLDISRDDLVEVLRKKGFVCEPTPVSPHGIVLDGTVPFRELDIKEQAVVQDEGAQMVSLMLASKPGERVLDACAAPGGKTSHMAAMMDDSGEIVALDSDEARLDMLRDNIDNLGIDCVSVHKADLLEYKDEDGFDAVLLDAPCSALGVIRRNPDIKYRRKQSDLQKYSATQYALLEAAARLVRPGGRLLYAVCSTEPEEGEQVVERLLKSSEEFDIIDNSSVMPEGIISEGGFMRTWPHADGMDGFFAAALRRLRGC